MSKRSTNTQARPTLHEGIAPARASFSKVFGWTFSSRAASVRSSVDTGYTSSEARGQVL